MTVRAILLLTLCCGMSAATFADDTEIDYLLSWIASSDCLFIRNGDQHDAVAAADHLAMKYRRVKRWIDSADEFIDRIASGSSLSGRDYLVNCPDQPEQTSRSWLTVALDEHRQAADAAPAPDVTDLTEAP